MVAVDEHDRLRRKRREELAVAQRPRIVARTGTDDLPVDYTQPARVRAGIPEAPPKKVAVAAGEAQIDYLDIPAFLRRQAD